MVKSKLVQGGDGTAIPAGFVGEVVKATITTTSLGAEADIGGASLALGVGLWEIYYSVSMYVVTGATINNSTSGFAKITNSSDVMLGSSLRRFIVQTVAGVSCTGEGCLAASESVNVTTPTTYKLRGLKVDGTGTGSAAIYNDASQASSFYAIRRA